MEIEGWYADEVCAPCLVTLKRRMKDKEMEE
jgi:hypothetical protein